MRNVIAANRRHTYPLTVSLEVHECAECGIVYGAPEEFFNRRRKDAETFYCPNGHSLGWHETEADRERKRAEKAESDYRFVREQRDAARQLAETERRSAIAYKGHLTRIRKRIANGTCPVPGCKRSGFDRVMSHIASQHPDWLHEHPEIAEPS